jgi:hypothetical protein
MSGIGRKLQRIKDDSRKIYHRDNDIQLHFCLTYLHNLRILAKLYLDPRNVISIFIKARQTT